MRSLIIAHETRTLARSPWLFWILGLIAAAILFAVWAGANWVGREQAGALAGTAYEQKLRDELLAGVVAYEKDVETAGGPYEFAAVNHAPGQGPPQGTNAGVIGSESSFYAVLPPTGLAAFSVGQSDILLSYVPINMRNIFDVSRQIELENPVNLQAGPFDLAFVVIFLLPILILAMTYDLLSSEKERGTLAMILAHPVSLRELMASKLISRARIVLTVVVLFGLGALLALGHNLDEADTWIRFAFWIGTTMLYGLFWFALAVLVNAFGRNSATNGILLAGSWLVFVVIIPTLVSLIASAAYPPPSRMELTTAARDSQTEAEKSLLQSLNAYYYDHAELVPEDQARDFLTLSLANSESIEKGVRPLYDEFQSQLNRQEALVARFQYLSPAIMMQLALNEISGTSADRYERFMNEVYAFHARLRSYFSPLFLEQRPLHSADFESFPRFEYAEEPLSAALSRLLPSVLGLIAAVGAFTTVAFMALRRFQVAGR